MNEQVLTTQLKNTAAALGFQLCGVCPAVRAPGYTRFREWLEAGYAGEMHYLPNRAGAYEHPDHVLDGTRSIMMLAMNYRTAEPPEVVLGQGRVSRYAWGAADYHDLIHDRLKQLAARLGELRPSARVRGIVDTAPLLERDFARLAGIGWIGKNTLLLNKQVGSWFFLAALLTDQQLDFDAPHDADHCGTCRACLDACPTQAFPEPYVLDARRCISYLNIELRGDIPPDQRAALGDWFFGCDICQEVCPWNRRAPESGESAYQRDADNPVTLSSLFEMEDAQLRAQFRKTPLWRLKRSGLLRNAAIVLGNQRDPAAIAALLRGLADADPVVRSACAWALGKHDRDDVRIQLRQALASEHSDDVRRELRQALEP